MSLDGRSILLALSGGIACYKSAAVASRLVQAGAQVRVIMTESATRFIAPLTFESLSGHRVLTSPWESDDRPDSQHVGLARWCDLMLIAPATAHTIAKLAHGLADDLVSLTAVALPRATPLVLAPAMNADMWVNPIVQANLTAVQTTLNAPCIGPEEGWQACRTAGAGRMSEPDAILEAVAEHFS